MPWFFSSHTSAPCTESLASTSVFFCSNLTGWTSLPGFWGSGMTVSVYSDSSESVFVPAWQWLCLHFQLFHPFLWPPPPPPIPPLPPPYPPHAHPTLLLCTTAMPPPLTSRTRKEEESDRDVVTWNLSGSCRALRRHWDTMRGKSGSEP